MKCSVCLKWHVSNPSNPKWHPNVLLVGNNSSFKSINVTEKPSLCHYKHITASMDHKTVLKQLYFVKETCPKQTRSPGTELQLVLEKCSQFLYKWLLLGSRPGRSAVRRDGARGDLLNWKGLKPSPRPSAHFLPTNQCDWIDFCGETSSNNSWVMSSLKDNIRTLQEMRTCLYSLEAPTNAVKFDMLLYSTAAEQPPKFQSNRIILICNFMASSFHKQFFLSRCLP